MADTAKLLAESHSIIYNEPEENITLNSIHYLLTQMNTKLTNIEHKNDSLEARLTAIECKMTSIHEMQSSLNTVKSQVEQLDEDVKCVKKDVQSLETNMNSLGNVFDSVKETVDSNKRNITDCQKITQQCTQAQRTAEDKMTAELRTVREESERLQSSVTDLKARSMRENLVFAGIPEDNREDTEAVLQEFLQRKYKLDYEIPFERVHRMGKWNEFNEHPRKIIAKFTYFKDREFIRTRAAQKLRGSRVWVNEQFPPEIEEKRKKLYPIMRQAKKDNKRTKLVRDTLYIDGEEYIPTSESANGRDPPARSKPSSASSNRSNPQTKRDRQPQKRQRQQSTPDREF